MNVRNLLILFIATHCWLSCSKSVPEEVPGTRITEDQRLQLSLARMHFDNRDFELARHEYVRIALNADSEYLKEVSQFMIGESFFNSNDCPQAERYFHAYIETFPHGFKRALSEVRIEECEHARVASETAWNRGYLRNKAKKRRPRKDAPPRRNLIEPPPESFSDKDINERVQFRTTWYWIVNEHDFERKDIVDVLDPFDRVVARVPRAFFKRLTVEGTGRLRNGQIVNWAAPGRYAITEAPYGLGAQGNHLVPFRTIAVDRSLIPLGTTIYIPNFAGVRLPSGEAHDGCFVAGDVGSAIKGRHIDIFSPSHPDALFVMQKVPEHVQLYNGDSRCKSSYEVTDGYGVLSKR